MTGLQLVEGLTDNLDYSSKSLQLFLDRVFHLDLNDNEEILCWQTQAALGLPLTATELKHVFEKEGPPKSFHFSCATSTMDLRDNSHYNSLDLAQRVFCFVIDGVGKRVPVKSLPQGMKEPTYKIMTAEGEYQYGYVFDRPIENMEQAAVFNQCLFASGLIPAGGNLPHQIVRLPIGVNGTIGKDRMTKLKIMPSKWKLFSPRKVVELLDVGVSWDDVKISPRRVMANLNSGMLGSTPWIEAQINFKSLTGLVDPILEWLHEKNMVMQDLNDIVTVRCTASHMHTDGSLFAEYKPIGRGQNLNTRQYRCLSDSCGSNSITAFLQWVAANKGPSAIEEDIVPELLRDYVFDLSENAVWCLNGTNQPRCFSMASFKNAFPSDVTITEAVGKPRRSKAVMEWLCSAYRVTVVGRRFDPKSKSKVTVEQGETLMNMFSMPDWGDGTYEQSHVDRFLAYIDYLIPSEEERKYFLDWLTCKMRDMSFRGAAILMIAHDRQGIGRNTLADMISSMVGAHNVEHIPFKQMTGDGSFHFNDWLEKPLVVTDETLSTGKSEAYKDAYEKLKNIVDPRPKPMRIDPKFGKQRVSMVYSSYLMFSNHENAMFLAENDRRFYVIKNADKAKSPEFFIDHNKWLNEMDDNNYPIWARHVYRYMVERDVDMGVMLSPPKQTDLKRRMIMASDSTISRIVQAALNEFDSGYVTFEIIKDILLDADNERSFFGNDKNIKAALASVRSLTMGVYKNSTPIKIGGKVAKVRAYIRKVGISEANMLSVMEANTETNAKIRVEVERALEQDPLLGAVFAVRDEIKQIMSDS